MGTSGLPAQQRRHFSEKRGDLLDLEPDSFDQNIAINTRAPFFLAQAFSKRLLAQPKPEAELPHRSIIFVSSINAIMLAMNRGEYTIAKTAVCLLLAFVMNKLAFMKCVLVSSKPI